MAPRLVAVTVQTTASPHPTTVFPLVMDVALPLIFTGFGPLPGVTEVREQSGPWDHMGASRKPVLTDGTTAFERITACSPPDSFAYEISGFTNILGRFVHGAVGSWDLTREDDAGTHIEWTYALPRLLQKALAFTPGTDASQDCSDVHFRADVFAVRCTGGRSPTVLRRTMRRNTRATTGARA